MTEGLVGRIDRPGAPRRRLRLFHALFARGMSIRYVFICTRARHTARLRALSNRLNVLWMLLLTRLVPFTRAAGKAQYALCRAEAVIEEKSLSGLKCLGEGIRDAAAFPRGGARKRYARLNTLLMFSAFTVIFMATNFFGVGLEVIVDGVSMGFVSSQHDFEQAVAGASKKASELLGRPYTLFANPLYQFSLVDKRQIFDREEAESLLLSSVSELKQLYVLTVDDVQVAASQTYADLRDMLDRKLAQYAISELGDQVTFYQDVRIEQRLAAASLEMKRDELGELIMSDIRPAVTHSVSEGDTVGKIAGSYGISEETLLSMNSGAFYGDDGAVVRAMSLAEPYTYSYDDNGEPVRAVDNTPAMSAGTSLAVGQELLVGEPIPFLSVCVTRQVSYTEPISFGTSYIEDDGMFDGDSRLASPGVEGEMAVSAELKLLNGAEVDRTVLETAVITEPVDEVIAKGTRVRYALGNFIRPYGGVLTSGYGNRYLFGKWDFHSGIDLAGPTGDSIVASDGGKVVFAGRQNGYGNLVIIDHQNGYKTAYAHCSKILVKIDQMVAQGEVIAKVGSTGVSTGSHLHFEIRTKDGTINPLKLIGK